MENKPVIVQITRGTLISALFLILLVWFLYQVISFVLIVITAVIFSLALAPGKRVLIRFGIPGPIAALILFIAFFLILASFLYNLIPILLSQYQVFLNAIPDFVTKLESVLAGTVFEGIGVNKIVPDFQDLVISVVGTTVPNIPSLFGGIINIILFFMLTFLFSVNPKSIDTFLEVITPKRYNVYVDDLWKRMQTKVGQWFQGQLIIVFIVFSLTYLALLLIGLPNALFLAVFAGMMGILPVLGPIIGAVPAILVAFASSGDVTLVLIVAGVFWVIQLLEGNLIYPLVVSKVIGISPILVILAVVIGGSLAGILGIIIAIPLSVLLQEFFNDIRKGKVKEMCNPKSGENCR